jgi:cellulose synthase/poly-beta-1,6-N-acetylglucosamine synthase-like glycosyltransferase
MEIDNLSLDTITSPEKRGADGGVKFLVWLKSKSPKISDRTVSPIVLSLVVFYLLSYGIFVSKGFHFVAFSMLFMLILIPVFLVDCLKNFGEIFVPANFYSSYEDLSKVTVVIACKDGGSVLTKTLKELVLRFDKDKIIVSSNGSSDSTCAIARSFDVKYLNIKESVGKVVAINTALSQVVTPYVLIMDDDTLIGRASIPTGALQAGYSAVAFRVLPVHDGWLSRLQMHEYRKSSDISKKYHNRHGSVGNISGAIGLFNTQELIRQIPLHTGEFAGEDLQRTLLLHLAANSDGVVLSDTIIRTQAPKNIKELFNQRVYGWNPGLYSNFLNFLKIIGNNKAPFIMRLEAFYNCFFVVVMDVLRLATLPILIFNPWYFVITYFAYVMFEIIFYVFMGRHEPLWVLFAFPIFGLFSFFTRLIAFGVFVYRRIAVKHANVEFLDGFRTVPQLSRFLGLMAVTGLFTGFVATNLMHVPAHIIESSTALLAQAL